MEWQWWSSRPVAAHTVVPLRRGHAPTEWLRWASTGWMKEENGSEGGEIEGGTNEWMNGWRDRRDEGRLHFPHSRRPYGRSSWIMRDLMMLFGAIGRAPATKVITMHEGKSWEYRLLQGGVAGSILAIIPKDLRYRYGTGTVQVNVRTTRMMSPPVLTSPDRILSLFAFAPSGSVLIFRRQKEKKNRSLLQVCTSLPELFTKEVVYDSQCRS